jgi:hypothetical protein
MDEGGPTNESCLLTINVGLLQNWMGDSNSPQRLQESYGITVNYLYDLARLDERARLFQQSGRVLTSDEIRQLALG